MCWRWSFPWPKFGHALAIWPGWRHLKQARAAKSRARSCSERRGSRRGCDTTASTSIAVGTVAFDAAAGGLVGTWSDAILGDLWGKVIVA